MYYRLYDKQAEDYLYTGYNSKNIKELTDSYRDLMIESGDWDVLIVNMFNNSTKKEKIEFIELFDYKLEKSKNKFKTL